MHYEASHRVHSAEVKDKKKIDLIRLVWMTTFIVQKNVVAIVIYYHT